MVGPWSPGEMVEPNTDECGSAWFGSGSLNISDFLFLKIPEKKMKKKILNILVFILQNQYGRDESLHHDVVLV